MINANNSCGGRREFRSSSYIQGFVRALRAFASWLHADGYTEANVLKLIKPPKVQQKVVQTLTDDEARAILKAINDLSPFGARTTR